MSIQKRTHTFLLFLLLVLIQANAKYDVFISFRGEDTGRSFTSHLYSALRRNQIDAYMDEESLEKGGDVSGALPKAIEESAISIIIFSKDYGSSTWCLNELVHILKCRKEKSQTVLPIFLGVDPSDIRKQKRSYAAAFVEHEKRFYNTMDKVQEWREALIEASGLSGWDSGVKYKLYERVIVDEVVEVVKEKLKHIGSNGRIQDLLESLKEELRLVNSALGDAEEKQLTDEDVREWLLNMKEVNYRAYELTDKINCEELSRKLGGASESLTSFATFNKSVEDEIAKISSKLKELDARKDKLGLKELPENTVSQRSYGVPSVREELRRQLGGQNQLEFSLSSFFYLFKKSMYFLFFFYNFFGTCLQISSHSRLIMMFFDPAVGQETLMMLFDFSSCPLTLATQSF